MLQVAGLKDKLSVVLGKTANDDKLIAALRKELVAATGGKAGCGRCGAFLCALNNAAAACDSIVPHTSLWVVAGRSACRAMLVLRQVAALRCPRRAAASWRSRWSSSRR